MGFWKVLGGIAAGVGAVALLPVAGAVGAVTATGAIVGGVVGAAVAVGTDDEEEKKRLREENERTSAACAVATSKAKQAVAESKEKVEFARQKVMQAEHRASEAEKNLQEAAQTMEQYRESLKDVESHYQLIVALTAIGMAAANADGNVDESETGEMDEYISGITAAKLPAKVKARIQYLHNHPPTFEKAAAEIAKLDKDGLPVEAFRQLIIDVIGADGVIEDSEKVFLKRWDDMVANGMVPVRVLAKSTKTKARAETKLSTAKSEVSARPKKFRQSKVGKSDVKKSDEVVVAKRKMSGAETRRTRAKKSVAKK